MIRRKKYILKSKHRNGRAEMEAGKRNVRDCVICTE